MCLMKLAFVKQHQIYKKIIFCFAIAQPSVNKQLYILNLLLHNNFNHHLNHHMIPIQMVYKLSHDYKMANLKRKRVTKLAKNPMD